MHLQVNRICTYRSWNCWLRFGWSRVFRGSFGLLGRSHQRLKFTYKVTYIADDSFTYIADDSFSLDDKRDYSFTTVYRGYVLYGDGWWAFIGEKYSKHIIYLKCSKPIIFRQVQRIPIIMWSKQRAFRVLKPDSFVVDISLYHLSYFKTETRWTYRISGSHISGHIYNHWKRNYSLIIILILVVSNQMCRKWVAIVAMKIVYHEFKWVENPVSLTDCWGE